MARKLNQRGSHIVVFASVLLAIGVIVFAGYTVLQRQPSENGVKTTSNAGSSSQAAGDSKDLTAIDSSLGGATSSVDTQLDSSSLDADLADLL
ncbi:MAG: hypothetical protein WAQ24_02970 [Candidatus Saccharimonadales bacterium]